MVATTDAQTTSSDAYTAGVLLCSLPACKAATLHVPSSCAEDDGLSRTLLPTSKTASA